MDRRGNFIRYVGEWRKKKKKKKKVPETRIPRGNIPREERNNGIGGEILDWPARGTGLKPYPDPRYTSII